ncbi:MAG: hypothetical protein ACM3S5_02140 [Rhodospirillales bacterium]
MEKSSGSVSKTYEVSMMLGSPYRRLVAIGGRPLPEDEQRREAQKMEEELAARKRESPEERQKRISKFLKQKREENLLLSEMARAFQFRLLGTQELRGHEVYVFDAEPDPDYKPVNSKAAVLTGMRGRLWIDVDSLRWVRVEAQVDRPVYFEGFLARIDPGTKFVLEKEPVEDDVWLPSRFEMQVNAKILGLISHNRSEQESYWRYRRTGDLAVGN